MRIMISKNSLPNKERQRNIERFGISFIRCLDIDVKTNLDGILQYLNKWIDKFEENS